MPKIKVCVAGASGWVGKELVRRISESSDMELSGAISRTYSGKPLSEITGKGEHTLIVSGSVREALKRETDVLIDYTSAEAVKTNVIDAINLEVNCVIGSSGLSDHDYEEIDSSALKMGVGVVAAGNFSLSSALLLHFSTMAARFMPSWEIIDYASDTKPDSPSGTARELAFRMSEISTPNFRIPPDKIIGEKQSRGLTLNGNQVHSIRLPGYIIGSEVIFGKKDEKLILRYEGGTGAEPYIDGTLMAVRKVQRLKGLIRGLDNLLDL